MKSIRLSRCHIKQFSAILLCIVMAAALLLPITAHAQDHSKTVRVGCWYE